VSAENLQWCLKQKRGIRIIEPNTNLAKAYMKKAQSALNIMAAAVEIREADWIATTAYYARYFALYALLMKMGIKSEIHDCTLNVARLLCKRGIIAQLLVDDIDLAKEARIENQYYVEREQDFRSLSQNVKAARSFVLDIQKVLDDLKFQQINDVREDLKRLRDA
jgi:uncharacterized protein (UPF0332 family)